MTTSNNPGLDKVMDQFADPENMSYAARHVAMIKSNLIKGPADALETVDRTLSAIGHSINELLYLERRSPEDIRVREILQNAEQGNATADDIRELEEILNHI